MSILHEVLHLFEASEPRGQRLPIDHFFRSLAEDSKERSIGVILSGMGSDGTLGLRAIKEKGGLALVQDPDSAKFTGMPNSAISFGLADIVARAEDILGKIMDFLQHTSAPSLQKTKLEDKELSALDKIVILLRSETGNDFSLYKKSTLYRRIERRMGIHQIDSIAGYVRYIQANHQELELLFKEFLIGVTSFFRDPAAWECLKNEVIPELLASHPEGGVLRAWSAGCSTGEEAYSLAIIFKEVLEQVKPKAHFSLQVFATDLDRDAIDKARQGLFLPNIASDVSAERLNRYFVKDEDGYRIKKEIREMVTFATQNVITDPPFTKLDILICRNLLIYLDVEMQKKLLPLFHYVLNPGGVLFLGSAETLGASAEIFTAINAKLRLFRRDNGTSRTNLVSFPSTFPLPASPHKELSPVKPEINVQALADQILLQKHSPPAVLVNEEGDIVYISARIGRYLEPPVGKANINVFAMAREGLRPELLSAFHKAMRQNAPVTTRNIRIGTNGRTQTIDLIVQKMEEPELQGMAMIIFKDLETCQDPVVKKRGVKSSDAVNVRIGELELELQQTQEKLRITLEELQTTREEMQTSQEELKASNEELQSINEELQSTNEELTTSKEEMQSMNGELQTVNSEQQAKVDELSHLNELETGGDELLRNREELEQRVQERTAELGRSMERQKEEIAGRLRAVEDLRNKELLLAQQGRMAAMGEMLTNISHQWRQSLNVMGLLIQQLGLFSESDCFDKQMVDTNVAKAMGILKHLSQTIDDFRTVTDNGGGVDENIIDKIFDPYFTTKELGKGSGIGLFMSKNIIERSMGGHLTVRNVEGCAEFRIEV